MINFTETCNQLLMTCPHIFTHLVIAVSARWKKSRLQSSLATETATLRDPMHISQRAHMPVHAMCWTELQGTTRKVGGTLHFCTKP